MFWLIFALQYLSGFVLFLWLSFWMIMALNKLVKIEDPHFFTFEEEEKTKMVSKDIKIRKMGQSTAAFPFPSCSACYFSLKNPFPRRCVWWRRTLSCPIWRMWWLSIRHVRIHGTLSPGSVWCVATSTKLFLTLHSAWSLIWLRWDLPRYVHLQITFCKIEY